MKHIMAMTKAPASAVTSPLVVKVNGALDIIDRLLLAQRQAQWKVPFPNGGTDTDTGTDTGTDTNTGTGT